MPMSLSPTTTGLPESPSTTQIWLMCSVPLENQVMPHVLPVVRPSLQAMLPTAGGVVWTPRMVTPPTVRVGVTLVLSNLMMA